MGVRYVVCIGVQLFRQLYILELERKITNFVNRILRVDVVVSCGAAAQANRIEVEPSFRDEFWRKGYFLGKSVLQPRCLRGCAN